MHGDFNLFLIFHYYQIFFLQNFHVYGNIYMNDAHNLGFNLGW